MNDGVKTVHTQFAGSVELSVDASADLAALTTAAVRDIRYQLAERWEPEYDPTSPLNSLIVDKVTTEVRPVFTGGEDFAARLAALATARDEYMKFRAEWVETRDQFRDEDGDIRADLREEYEKKVAEYDAGFNDLCDTLAEAATSVLLAVPPTE
ncbi:hypothetical protein ABZ281_07615 [Streptomyces sp. NPDC006265]|uniref:hypothetical protein n=1 Tax=Streptomyces sp. NPDC006265 TaxID=3156740 RepID=UPI0033A227C6